MKRLVLILLIVLAVLTGYSQAIELGTPFQRMSSQPLNVTDTALTIALRDAKQTLYDGAKCFVYENNTDYVYYDSSWHVNDPLSNPLMRYYLMDMISNYDFYNYEGNPILSPTQGEFDDDGVIDPSIIKLSDTLYRMYYIGTNLTSQNRWFVGVRESYDGFSNWDTVTGVGYDYVFETSDQSSTDNWNYYGWEARVLYDTTGHDSMDYKMYYQGATYYGLDVGGGVMKKKYSTGFSYSNDGITWTDYYDNPVVVGDSLYWDEFYAGARDVILVDTTYYMFYEACDFGVNTGYYKFRTGLATSQDGITWTKSYNNPVATFSDNNNIPSTVYWNGAFVQFMSSNTAVMNPTESKDDYTYTGLAVSVNGHDWDYFNIDNVFDLQNDLDTTKWGVNGVEQRYLNGEVVEAIIADPVKLRILVYYRVKQEMSWDVGVKKWNTGVVILSPRHYNSVSIRDTISVLSNNGRMSFYIQDNDTAIIHSDSALKLDIPNTVDIANDNIDISGDWEISGDWTVRGDWRFNGGQWVGSFQLDSMFKIIPSADTGASGRFGNVLLLDDDSLLYFHNGYKWMKINISNP